jgi:transposase
MLSDISLEERVPASHPLRKLRFLVDALLATMNREFEAVYARRGRPSVPPERLLNVPPARRRRTHESTTDADARLFKKSPGDKGNDCKAFNSAPTPAREISASRG